MTDPHADTPLFDPSRLGPEDQEVWTSVIGKPIEPVPMTVSDLFSVGHIFMIEGAGVPEMIVERIAELDPEQHVAAHMDSVRRARHSGSDRAADNNDDPGEP